MMHRAIASIVAVIAFAAPASARSAEPGWLGFGYSYHQAADGSHFVLVRQLFVGGPAERAGLRPQDVITRIDGNAIVFHDDVAAVRFFDSVRRAQRVSFVVRRAKRILTIVVEAESVPPNIAERRAQNERLARARMRQ